MWSRAAVIVILSLALASPAIAADPNSVAPTDTAQTRSVVRAYLAAADRGDASAAAANFASDAAYEDKTYAFKITGVPAIQAMLASAFAGMKPVKRSILREIYDGPHAVIEWVAVGKHAAPILGVPASGRDITVRAVSMIEVHAGKIRSVTDYTDRVALEKQLRP